MSLLTSASIALTLSAVVVWRSAFAARAMGFVVALLVLIALSLSGSYLVVDALTGNGIDESVLYHLEVGMKGSGYGDFRGLIAFSIVYSVMAIGFSILAIKTSASRSRPPAAGAKTRAVVGFLTIALSFVINPAVHDVTQLVQRANASTSAPPALYIENKRIALPDARKNFVILYLEQLERTYFDETQFPGLMPNLSALESQAQSFTDIQEVPGTEWTMGGMTASLCGVPLVAPHGNMMSRIDRFLPGATCIGDLLSPVGYQLDYMGGAALDFAGKGNFYRTHGFDRVHGRAVLEPLLDDPDYTSWWGLYDDSLFDLARKRFDELAAKDQPFGLVLLTLDTHQPDGHLAAACGDRVYGDGTNPILNAVHCADRMVADFIRHIRQSPAAEKTILVVASDHLAMPNTASKRLAAAERRNLLLIFGPGIAPGKVDKPGSTLDVAPTLLNLLGADIMGHGFGRDLLKPGPTISQMERSASEVLWTHWKFFNVLWSFPQLDGGIRIDLAGDRLFLGDRFLGLPALFVVDEDFTVSEVRFEFDSPETLQEQAAQLPFDQFIIWVDVCEKIAALEIALPGRHDRHCAVFGALGDAGLTAISLPDGMSIDPALLRTAHQRSAPNPDVWSARNAAFKRSNRFAANDVVLYEPSSTLQGHFGFVSSGLVAEPSLVKNLELDATAELLRGLTILGLDPDLAPQKLGHIDTCAYQETLQDTVPLTSDFGTVLGLNKDRFGGFAIVAHDSVLCDGIPDLGRLFAGTRLDRWADIGYRQPYIALIDGNGEVVEYLGEAERSMAVEAIGFIRPMDP